MKQKLIAVLCCTALLVPFASAHPGKTDANGGHYDRSTGEYHYHHGYSAHQHPNGICPYDFDNQTEVQELTTASESSDYGEYDYGPEAETDFESKREAWASGYESAIDHSNDSFYADSAYNNGYEEGYKQGLADNQGDGYEEGYNKGYDDGYREGYNAIESGPDNDIIDRSEVHTSVHDSDLSNPTPKKQTKFSLTNHIELLILGVIGAVAIIAYLIKCR